MSRGWVPGMRSILTLIISVDGSTRDPFDALRESVESDILRVGMVISVMLRDSPFQLDLLK